MRLYQSYRHSCVAQCGSVLNTVQNKSPLQNVDCAGILCYKSPFAKPCSANPCLWESRSNNRSHLHPWQTQPLPYKIYPVPSQVVQHPNQADTQQTSFSVAGIACISSTTYTFLLPLITLLCNVFRWRLPFIVITSTHTSLKHCVPHSQYQSSV